MADDEQIKKSEPSATPESPSPTSQAQTVAEPPKKKSVGKWIALGCAGLLILGLLIGGAIGIFVYFGYKSITKPVGTIKNHLQAINDGDIRKAYDDYTSKRFKEAMPYDQFAQLVEENSSVLKSKSSSFTNVQIENGVAKVEGTITGKSGATAKATYELVQEEGEWKIQYFKLE